MQTKEDLKTVALGTSKINYLDPRITVAWCKRHEVPIEKVSSILLPSWCTVCYFLNRTVHIFFCNAVQDQGSVFLLFFVLHRYSTSLFQQSLLGQWTSIPTSDSDCCLYLWWSQIILRPGSSSKERKKEEMEQEKLNCTILHYIQFFLFNPFSCRGKSHDHDVCLSNLLIIFGVNGSFLTLPIPIPLPLPLPKLCYENI